MSARRRPAAPGYRPKPRKRYSRRVCLVCAGSFVLDRVAHPWSRARTCSIRCARIMGNRNRRPSTCRHCDMVEAFRLAQDSDIRRIDTACRDEDARPVSFREWLTFYPWGDVEPAA